jgi:hypothetical protein
MTIETISQSEYESLSDEEKLSYEPISEEDIAEVSDLTKAKFYAGTMERRRAVDKAHPAKGAASPEGRPEHAKDMAKQEKSRDFAYEKFAPVAKKMSPSGDAGVGLDKVFAKHGTTYRKEVDKMTAPAKAAAAVRQKMASKLSEEDDMTITQSEYEALSDEEKLQYEPAAANITEVSLGRVMKAVSKDATPDSKIDPLVDSVRRKFGDAAADHVSSHYDAQVYGRTRGYQKGDPLADRSNALKYLSSKRGKVNALKRDIKDQHGKYPKPHLPEETDSMTTNPEHDEEVAVTESAASETLVAGRNVDNDPKTKIEAIASMIGAMHAMKKDDCISWFNQTMAQFGKFGDGAPDASSSNRSSINMKGTVREEVADLFAGDDLSEEFKEKAQTIFEAALTAEVITQLELAEEEMQAEFEQKLDEAVEGLAEQMNSYLDYAVGQWIKDNEVAIETSLRSEIAEDILAGIKQVFVENNVEIDEEQVDVVEALAAEVDELKEGMNALIEERQALQAQLVEAAREKAVGEVSEGMTVSDAEKFRVLTEEVEASDLSAFRRKIEVIREAMFKAPTSKEDAATVLTESVEPEQSNDKFVGAAPEVLAYAKAISRTTRR